MTCDRPNPRQPAKRCSRPAGHRDQFCHHEDPDELRALGYRATSVTIWRNPDAPPVDPLTGFPLPAPSAP